MVRESRHARDVVSVRRLVLDCELRPALRALQAAVERGPVNRNRGVLRRRPASLHEIVRARAPLGLDSLGLLADVIELERHDRRRGGADVVNDRRRPIECQGIIRRKRIRQQLPLRTDDDPIERLERALGGRVVPPDRFDDVADELEADRLNLARRVEIQDAAANAELTVLVNGILRRKPGHGEVFAKVLRRDFVARRDRQARHAEPGGCRQPGEQ